MVLRRLGWLVLCGFCLLPPAFASHPKSCVSLDDAAKFANKDVCITAHIYEVVEMPDGTRYLDVCSPDTPDERCRFTIVSLREDRDEVGELRKYRDMDVQIRGIVRPMHGRAGMVLSHARQFYGGPPKPAKPGRAPELYELPRPGAAGQEDAAVKVTAALPAAADIAAQFLQRITCTAPVHTPACQREDHGA